MDKDNNNKHLTQEFHLSSSQERYWLMSNFYPGADAYNMSLGLVVDREVELDLLQNALKQVVASTSALRISFHISDDSIRQGIIGDNNKKLPLHSEDISQFSNQERENIKKRFLHMPFNLEADSYLWRLACFKEAENRYYLYWVCHHIICDAISFQLLFKKLSDYYESNKQGPDDTYFFEEFLEHEHIYLSNSQLYRENKAFWQSYLPSILPQLFTQAAPSTAVKSQSDRICLHITPAETASLQQFCAEHNTTLYVTLFAAYFLALSHLTGERKFAVGAMVSGRELLDRMDAIGCFSNLLPIYYEVAGNDTVSEYISAFQQKLFDALEHSSLPFQEILEDFCLKNNPVQRTLFDSLFILQQDLVASDSLFGDFNSYFDEQDYERSFAEFPLAIYIRQSKRGLFFNFQYKTTNFSREQISTFTKTFHDILEGMMKFADEKCLSFLCANQEEEQKIKSLNLTHRDYPNNLSCYELFEQTARERPNKIAIHYLDQKMTYDELRQKAENYSLYLLGQGLKPGDFVGICLERTPELIAAILGILRLGCAYVPFDMRFPQERLRSVVNRSDAKHILCSTNTASLFAWCDLPLTDVVTISMQPGQDFDINNNLLEIPCYRLFTSGSTGIPKAVTIFQENLLNLLYWSREFFVKDELAAFLVSTQVTFDVSVFEIFAPLCTGGKLILADNTLQYNELPAKDQVITLSGTPSAIAKMIQENRLSTAVKYLFLCGEAAPQTLIDAVFKLTSIDTIINAYGLTELTVYSTFDVIRRTDACHNVTIGKPIANTHVHVLNEYLHHTPFYVVGDIYISGKGLPRCDEQFNTDFAAVLHAALDKAETSAFMLKTGDKGYLRGDGKIVCLGRTDQQIKLRGYRIEQEEIETVLKRYPGITEAVVCLNNHSQLGPILVAYYSHCSSIDKPELTRHLEKYLPKHFIPSFLIPVETFPVNSSSKIDRKMLSQLPLEVVDSAPNDTSTNAYEDCIKSIWQRVLGRANITSNDSFFLLGGHSLLVLEVRSAIDKELGLKLPLADFFMYPTLKELAAYILNKSGRVDHTQEALRAEFVTQSFQSDDIAIIGVACKLPDASNPDEFWQLLSEYKSAVKEIPADRWDWKKYYHPERTQPGCCIGKWGTFVADIDLFDPSFFGVSTREAKIMDPQQRLLLETAWQTFENAGYSPALLAEKQQEVGVYVGASLMDYSYLLAAAGLSKDPYFATGNSLSLLANRISYLLGLSGPSMTIDTACSSALTAIHLAVQSLRLGQIDVALVGSAALMLSPDNFVIWSQMGILAETKDSSAFEADSTGFIPGEGVVCCMLKPLQKAIADRDNILGVIKGTAVNHDGRTKVGLNATSPKAQADLIIKAWKDAKITAHDIDYIETHGTGTQLGDAVELTGLSAAFANYNRTLSCPIGSVKPLTGHTGPVAGMASLLKILLSFEKQQLPATKVKQINPNLDISNKPFHVHTKNCEWLIENEKTVAISAFGFAGTNAHIVVSSYHKDSEVAPSLEANLFVLSAKTDHALQDLVKAMNSYLSANASRLSLPDVCFTLGTGREHFQKRFAVIANSTNELIDITANWLSNPDQVIEGIYTSGSHSDVTARSSEQQHLDDLAYAYTQGKHIDFEALYHQKSVRRVVLPNYPFERHSCWYQEKQAVAQTTLNKTPLIEQNWLHKPIWHQVDIKVDEIIDSDVWLVFVDSHGLGLQLLDKLRQKKQKTYAVYMADQFNYDQDVFEINHNSADDYLRLLKNVIQQGYTKLTVIHAWSLARFAGWSEKELEKGIFSLHLLASAMKQFPVSYQVKIVTNNTQSVLSQKPVFPLHATIWGFAKAWRAESESLALQMIDLEKSNLDAVKTQGNFFDLLIGKTNVAEDFVVRDGQCYVARNELVPTITNHQRLKSNATYLLLGGTGDIGLALTDMLLDKYHSNVVLVSRNVSIALELYKDYPNVLILKGDITSLDDMHAVVNEAMAKFGTLEGVFHLSGAINNATIAHKTRQEIKQVLGPKLNGSLVLSEVLKKNPPKFVVYFSSISSLIDSPRLSDYAAANAFLNSYSQYQANSVTAVINLCWCGWKLGLGYRNQELQAENIFLADTALALQQLERALATKESSLVIAHPKQLNEHLVPVTPNTIQLSGSNDSRSLTDWLVNLIAELTELPLEKIQPHIPFLELGIDSILSARLTQLLNRNLNRQYKPTLFYEYHTIDELATFLLADRVVVKNDEKAVSSSDVDLQAKLEQKKFAVIGLACVLPGASTADAYWQNLCDGFDAVSRRSYEDLTAVRPYILNDTYKGKQFDVGFLSDELICNRLNATFSQHEIKNLSKQQQWLAELTYEAIASARLTPDAFDKRRVGVFLGAMTNIVSWDYEREPTNKENPANFISRLLNVHGPSQCIETLCSSTLVALHLAVRSLRRGECDYALVGGMRLDIEPGYLTNVEMMKALSPTGKCQSFSANADGFVPGEGGVMLLLTSQEHAREQNYTSWGSILGSAINHGGKGSGFLTPNARAHKQVIQAAWKDADIHPASISFIEAHGTGTELGDPIEIDGLTAAFRDHISAKQFCAIGTVKSNIGHLEPIAGLAGVVKVLLAMRHKFLPQNIHLDSINPLINFTESPFYPLQKSQQWAVNAGEIRRAGISSFGIGGSNAHIILEEA